MGYFPGDLNGFPGYLAQDWDPTTMTPIPNDPNCQSKFCLGKRALYVALPQYSSRIDMGLATYNQYYEIASNPPNFRTVCTYDEINVNSSAFGLPGTYFRTRRPPSETRTPTRRPFPGRSSPARRPTPWAPTTV